MVRKHSLMSIIQGKYMAQIFMGFLAIISTGILLMPIGSSNKEKTMLFMYLSGAFFWLGLIGTACMTFAIIHGRKKCDQFNEQFSNKKRFGLIHFFQNKEATIADIAMFASIIGFVIAKLCSGPLILVFAFLAAFVFAFGMHCMLNGISYEYLKYTVRGDKKS